MNRKIRGVAGRLLALAVACTCVWPAIVTATEMRDLGAVRQLLESRQDEDAYARLQPWLAEAAGEPAFDYLLGIAALRTGRAVEAILAFERLVDAEPGNVEARAYLARALFEAGENATARTEFQRVLDAGAALPPPVSNEIAQYLSAIEARLDRDATRWALFF